MSLYFEHRLGIPDQPRRLFLAFTFYITRLSPLLKATRDHHLIDLHPKYGDPQQETKESADQAELSSDFLEQLTVTENFVLYRAQVAVDREVDTQSG